MSTTYIAVLVTLLAQFLPLLGITIGSEALTTTVQTLVTFIAGVWILVRRYAKGDITLAGLKD